MTNQSIILSRKHIISILLAIVCCVSFNHSIWAKSLNGVEVDAVRIVAEKFCYADFEGDPDIRMDIAKYTTSRRKEESRKDPELLGKVIAFEADPIFVVKSFKITNILVEKNTAVVTVIFDRIAKSMGSGLPGRKIITDDLKQDVVKLQFIRDQEKWWILDPPIPRVSVKALHQFYKDRIDSMADWIFTKRASESQKNNYEEMNKTLEILKSLM
ncbi:hypothetical protein [Nitrosomonas sp. sh817]|uniref:hypothetical protein n=1 Tax=Nitrosomonas sp. sh817 TaxID=3070658 RepID=UPI0027DB5A26|nr:hypothetical protein [Nitrosomonas sp. sh817]WMJ08684.1 hypothetical protein RBH92_00300 [Nitrosomonas sp. sh817]